MTASAGAVLIVARMSALVTSTAESRGVPDCDRVTACDATNRIASMVRSVGRIGPPGTRTTRNLRELTPLHAGGIGTSAHSPRERVGAQLNLIHLGSRRGAPFVVEHRARAGGGPHSASFPAGVRVVDAAIHVLADEAHGLRNLNGHELAVDEREERL